MIYLALWLLDVYGGIVHSIVFITLASITVAGGLFWYGISYAGEMPTRVITIILHNPPHIALTNR